MSRNHYLMSASASAQLEIDYLRGQLNEAKTELRKYKPKLSKMEIAIKKQISREVIENIFVTAFEGGSNYWYYLSEDAVKSIRKAVPKSKTPYLSVAIVEAILDHDVEVAINDAEDEDEVVGVLSKKTMGERFQKLAESPEAWALENELNGQGDADSSDVILQYLAMGEVVFG